MTGLRACDLNYSYGAKQALEDVSFEVGAGRFCALLGPNGAGKSTLFGLLTRLLVAPGGKIEIAGHDLARARRAALADLGIVFQQSTLDLDLTVRQNLSYFAALQGLSGRAVGARIDVALDQLEMRDRAGEKARALNGGHRRRTELARALLHDPAVLLLDEPTVGLDAAARASITAHAHRLAEGGKTILWATHLTDEVQPMDDLIILHRARVLSRGTARDVAGDMTLHERFLTLTGAAA
ncbi:putative ABC transporter ATP-binding protein YbhF (plasmid) [Sulfitobacter sp. THAF37]|uniref:ATP-binding cassette domain-containing protein n=1 Tax=Sulfitobacter sp. THAF37 TaxID=2587855 RepID=UPI001267C84D|nr:ATP-binding cassette domain-containing protein [Sulfitobacter sp. THAF37]QFT60843.1 putative ABC transporter ATP-binding protein YbhF [Sulfitobacter sp. THAF37]